MDHFHYFYLTLAGCFLAVRFWPWLEARILRTTSRLSSRAFISSSQEWPKFALLRIVFGGIIAWRGIDLWLLLAPSDFTHPYVAYFATCAVVAGLAVMFGFFTQFAIAFLMIVQWHRGDAQLGTSTLGNDVGAVVALLLFMVNAGRLYSFDSWLIRRLPRLRPLLFYYGDVPSAATITTAKLLGLFSFWMLCLYSLAMHLNEPAWMTGTAGPQLLSNTFISAYHDFFIEQFSAHDWAVFLGRLVMWLMLPWYVLVLPGVLYGGIWRLYSIVWGILFFIVAKFILQLGWLPEIEFTLWACLFWQRSGIVYPQRLVIAFDDTCNLCDRTVQLIRRLDIFDRARLMPASQNKDWLAQRGISYERAMEDLHGIDLATGRIRAGYDFYIQLSRHIVLLWPLYPILMLGKWLFIGPILYRFIARRRKAIFGTCTVPSSKRALTSYPIEGEGRWQKRTTATFVLHIALLSPFFVAAIPAPFIGHAGWSNLLANSAHIYGIAPLNVFNHEDLRLAENWFTLSLKEDGKETLLPILGENGKRLAYHRSDRVYFGNTLAYRRMIINSSGCQYEPWLKVPAEYLSRVFLTHEGYPPGTYHFRYRQYFQPLPDYGLLEQNRYVRAAVTRRCTIDYTLSEPPAHPVGAM